MKGLLVSLAVLCTVVELTHALWICPPKAQVPTIQNVRFGRRQPKERNCLEIPLPDDHLPYFVQLETQNSLIGNDLIKVYPLDMFPGFYAAIVHNQALQEFDLMTSGSSKQLISPPGLFSSKYEPKLPPKFKKTAIKDDIVNNLDGDAYYTEMEKITGVTSFTVGGRPYTISTRYTSTQDNNDVAAYFLQRFRELGLEAFYQTFRYGGQSVQNIIGIKHGSSKNIIVVGGHYDSTSPSPQTNAPGCIDNGSGSEGVMQIAAAFANYNMTETIHFVLFGVEEQGLHGSYYYVDNLSNNGYNVDYSLVMDMIGYSDNYHGVRLETRNTDENRALLDLTEDNLNAYSPSLSVVRNYVPFGSDHVPFLNEGIPCFLAIERDGTQYPGYHQTSDRISYLSVDQSIDILRGLAGTLYDLAS